MIIGNPQVLEKYRIKKNLSITELSARMGKTPGWYSRIRNGKHPLRSEYIVPISKVFGVKPEKLAKEYYSEFQLEDSASKEVS